jgi:hypothetical protein
MENLLCFWCLENLLVPHIERIHTSKFTVNSPLLVLNISNKIGFISFGVSLKKLFEFVGCPVRPQVRPGLVPGRTIRWQTGPVQRGTELLYWRVFWRRDGKFRQVAGPSGLQSGGAGLTAKLSSGLLPTAIFSPPINTPSSSLC